MYGVLVHVCILELVGVCVSSMCVGGESVGSVVCLVYGVLVHVYILELVSVWVSDLS